MRQLARIAVQAANLAVVVGQGIAFRKAGNL